MSDALENSGLDADFISLLRAIRAHVIAYYDGAVDTELAHAIHGEAEVLVLEYIARKYRVMHGHDVRKVLLQSRQANDPQSHLPGSDAHLRLSEKLSDNVWRHHRGTPTDVANLYLFLTMAFYPFSREPMPYRGAYAGVIQQYCDDLLRWHEGC